jgi:hypothetical protein
VGEIYRWRRFQGDSAVTFFDGFKDRPPFLWSRRVERRLDLILNLLEQIMTALTDLQTQVAQNTTVEGSAVTLIQGIATQIAAAVAASPGTPDPALVTLTQQLQSSATALAAAITANTPAASGTSGGTPPTPSTPLV